MGGKGVERGGKRMGLTSDVVIADVDITDGMWPSLMSYH